MCHRTDLHRHAQSGLAHLLAGLVEAGGHQVNDEIRHGRLHLRVVRVPAEATNSFMFPSQQEHAARAVRLAQSTTPNVGTPSITMAAVRPAQHAVCRSVCTLHRRLVSPCGACSWLAAPHESDWSAHTQASHAGPSRVRALPQAGEPVRSFVRGAEVHQPALRQQADLHSPRPQHHQVHAARWGR